MPLTPLTVLDCPPGTAPAERLAAVHAQSTRKRWLPAR